MLLLPPLVPPPLLVRATLDADTSLADTVRLPQVDMGQCNDAYSAIVVASKLAEAFGTDVNGLPLSLDLSW